MGSIDVVRSAIADQVKFDIFTQSQEADNEKARQQVARSFISDTITVPTKEMYAYASMASLGDDVYHEPSMIALEAHMAKLTGKEAALFVPSGTMSNQLALRTHLKQPPYAVLCDHRSHIHQYEAGGTAFHSGATTITVIPSNGHHLTLADVQSHIVLGDNIHTAPVEVVSLENTLNGTIIPQEEVIAISDYVHSQGLKMHLDGARLWHVASETGTPISELCAPFDTVSLCFSKGLGAPIGSCLVGPKDFIKRARWFRKLFGGGMRQTGFLAASAAYALTYNFPRLAAVHQLTKRLENGLKNIGINITSPAETCMVFFDPAPIGVTYSEIIERCDALPNPIQLGGSRLVVHIQTSEEMVDDFLDLLRTLADEKKAAGFVYSPHANGNANGNIYIRASKKQ
ncbi:pyridoxal phosphate-dependent transferase [Cristinia sonorae]|uniref:Pyridoxal phosphate-dependent transferase n=1 Tax=Cristinia sonorae TaxID=1940300 RepID=A0A8K0UPN5_9AGAR|nr:pyridoxal phosphate-dependent transferase [Cristinia sonorae]